MHLQHLEEHPELIDPRLHQPEMNVLTETEIAALWNAYLQLEADATDEEQHVWRAWLSPCGVVRPDLPASPGKLGKSFAGDLQWKHKGPFPGPLKVAGAGFEPATSGL
jgi:hypothetical protein